ncbi:MAG: hypothetical protein WBC85_05740 [Planktotalea sp.]|uniref:hypothetical protein n=1 Tax=Planktotalea sp. TaxID=2029877 RepID=UPI003C767D5F
MIRSVIISGAALLVLAGCEDPKHAQLFDGMRYSGRLQVESESRRNFTATVTPVSQGLEGAREAARFEGTTHCVRKYGSSDIIWTLSPDADATALSIENDQLTVQGRCAE